MSVVRSAQHAIKPILTLANKHPRLLIVTAFATISTPWLYGNYRAFIDLGPGGLPYNVFGWLAALSLKLVARETKTTEEYVKDGSQERWLKDEDVKQREGDRPRFGWHVAPVRQQDMLPSAEMAKRLDDVFDRVVKLNPTLLEYGRSPHEKIHDGIVLHSSFTAPHNVATAARREVGHIHPSDHSLHLVLSPLDCKAVIEKGWGERHPLSGARAIGIPKEYIGIYAPRDEEELAIVEKIVIAAVSYMTGQADIQH